ncbi:MAG: uracil-DNA glycosylase family protein [Cyclobacteriaceae bacterium]|nr:uracil-DNA glycosylase family protein [Cyclobacteriaceae bacterium]
MRKLKLDIKNCALCEKYLPLGPNPVFQFAKRTPIIIVGQAPGKKVHESGIPWGDASGDRLREWLGVTNDEFYNEAKIGLVPMGFCYPGKGKSGDLPPREECAPTWHNRIFDAVGEVKLLLLIGQYAQAYYLRERNKSTLTETVRSFQEYGPNIITLPHPSPRNNIWLKKNPWFLKQLLPVLKERIRTILG